MTRVHQGMHCYVERASGEVILESVSSGLGWNLSRQLESGSSNPSEFCAGAPSWARHFHSQEPPTPQVLVFVEGVPLATNRPRQTLERRHSSGDIEQWTTHGSPGTSPASRLSSFMRSKRSKSPAPGREASLDVGQPQSMFGHRQPRVDCPLHAYGIAGVLETFCGTVLLLITGVTPVGCCFGNAVFGVSEIKVVFMQGMEREPSDELMEYDVEHVTAVKEYLEGGNLFFSYSLDLTTRFQEQAERTMEGKSLWTVAHEEFFFNHHLLQPLMDLKLDNWILPLICGYVSINKILLDRHSQRMALILISRRHRKRMGTRYRSRGVDESGHVSNFVETEQVLADRQGFSAFVQIRGSVPVFWSQRGFAIRPRIRVMQDLEKNASACAKHFGSILGGYGKVFVVNLLKEQGDEGLLTQEFSFQIHNYNKGFVIEEPVEEEEPVTVEEVPTRTVLLQGHSLATGSVLSGLMGAIAPVHEEQGSLANGLAMAATEVVRRDAMSREEMEETAHTEEEWVVLNEPQSDARRKIFRRGGGTASLEVEYIYFNFHKECSGTKWTQLSHLLELTQSGAAMVGMFRQSANGMILSRQRGVFRVNCADCLDRTNVCQSMFARRALEDSLERSLERSPAVHDLFNVWADNGDRISLQYAGTAALKGDVTRGGRRVLRGALSDGVNSLTRSYINHFQDGLRHACLELMTGVRRADRDHPMEFLNDPGELLAWEEEREAHLKACRQAVPTPEEVFVGHWIILSINKWDATQERILILTDQALYRVKWDFDEEKVIKVSRNALSSIIKLERGRLFRKRYRRRVEGMHGIRIHHGEGGRSRVRGVLPKESFRTYCPFLPGTATDVEENQMLDGMVDCLRRASGLDVDEVEGLERRSVTPVISGLYNKMGVGKWH